MTAINTLLAGFQRFRRHYFDPRPVSFNTLAQQGQSPQVMVVACCDSRVDPAIILDAAPGELFVVRNVANLVPPYESSGSHHGTSAALEFATQRLGVKHIIVLGHSGCSGIRSLMEDTTSAPSDFLSAWMDIAQPARARVLAAPASGPPDFDERLHACEIASIEISLVNLMSFPWIAERVAAGNLSVHGWYFDIAQGQLLDCQAGQNGRGALTQS